MNRDNLINLAQSFSSVSLFHEIYARVNNETIVFAIVVYDGHPTGNPMFVKTFDVASNKTSETLRGGAFAESQIEALRSHFSDSTVRTEGLSCLKCHLKSPECADAPENEYGQLMHASDLEELRVGANEWVYPGNSYFTIGSDTFELIQG